MTKDEGQIYYFPPIRSFKDTGYITHGFADGSIISARVEKSNDSGGFEIHLTIKDGDGESVCDFSMDKFAALCLIDCVNKNLLNQEEVLYNEYYKPKSEQ